jgi:hypothetical protein
VDLDLGFLRFRDWCVLGSNLLRKAIAFGFLAACRLSL